MSRFVASPGAQAEVNAIVRPHLERLAVDVQRRARLKLRKAKIGDTGKLYEGINFSVTVTPSGLDMRVTSSRTLGDRNQNVPMVIHQGHGVIRPLPGNKAGGYLVFKPKGAKFTVRVRSVRAVDGVPFLTEALREACQASGLNWQFTDNSSARRIRGRGAPHTSGR